MKYVIPSVIIGILLLIGVIVVIILTKYLKLKDILENLDNCEQNLDEILNDKEKSLDILVKEVNDAKLTELFTINENATVFEKEEILFNTRWEINKIIEKDGKLTDKTGIIKHLNDIEDGIEGLKDYYNSNSLNYNEIYRKKPFNMVYKLLKLKEQDSFKLRKLQEYEILKD